MYSEKYIEHLKAGSFPGSIDPWSEAGRYFHQLHGAMITDLIMQIQDKLLMRGYIAGREASLQIMENRQPDIAIHHQQEGEIPKQAWDYHNAAQAVMAEPGVALEATPPELDAIFISDFEGGRLVTVVEIVSPRNKTEFSVIREYQERRDQMRRQGVNVVEIDLTRSVKRLIHDPLVDPYSYHIAIHLYDQIPRLIGIAFGESLKRCALPLRQEVIPVELQDAYKHAYHQNSLAGHIQRETSYHEDALPFPSLFSPQQRQQLLQKIQTWQAELNRLGATP